MRTILLVLVIYFWHISAKADTLTLYFEFELEKNQRLVLMTDYKSLYVSPENRNYLFDSIKIPRDSLNKYRRMDLYIVNERLLRTKWQRLHYTLQFLDGYNYVLFLERGNNKRHTIIDTFYFKEPISKRFTIHCGLSRWWRLKFFLRRFS